MSYRSVFAVFGGGGAKAASQLGAQRALAEAGITPSRYAGTSMGAVIAAMSAAGLSPDEALLRLLGARTEAIVALDRLAMFKGVYARSLLRPGPLRDAIIRLLPVHRFEDLELPLTVTATDVDSGELTLFGTGGRDVPLVDALCASCALPVYYPPVVIAGRRYADGGLRSVLPLEVSLPWNPELVVAVDAGPGLDERPASERSRLPALIDAHDTSLWILMAGGTRGTVDLWRATPGRPPLLYVRPSFQRGSTFRINMISSYVEEGYRSARAAVAGLIPGE
jgi:NTE family protein